MSAEFGFIEAISVSGRRGIAKTNVPSALFVAEWGIKGDVHAGDWHRQVSLLALESVERMREMGADVNPGDFAENLTIRGLDVPHLQIRDRLICGDVELEVTQIGKECHHQCAIYHSVGDCVMPREGVFTRVVKGGRLTVGMKMILLRGAFSFGH